MQELTGAKNAIELGGTDSQLIDPTRRRLLAKTREVERPRHLGKQSEMRISSLTSTNGHSLFGEHVRIMQETTVLV